ncbi:MAG: preprotein translocase subunit SecF [Candidatus Entotheonella factor]|uniref:Protein-export membrane protein SecF n=1 Tax=Entotheonella factor TaxID=1429438 RepID=W4LWS1_ENTF1|nr:MAG: preprotein translocase subunit SecF [Candidatus Entotheonella factor]
MLTIIPPGLRIDFVARAKQAMILSAFVILIGLISIILRGGLNLGIDFSGGTLLQLRFSEPAVISSIRDVLGGLELGNSVVQHFGEDREVLIRVPDVATGQANIGSRVQEALKAQFPEQDIELRRAEVVGPQVSADLRRQALFALFYAILGIVIYISGRFEAKWFAAVGLAVALFAVTYSITQWLPGVAPTILIIVALLVAIVFCLFLQLRYALAAIVALFHDVLITVGFFSLFDKPFNLPIVAALLTIVGYSLNDTIIVFDRIRENMHGQRREQFSEAVNLSINQTLSRTVLTSGTTLVVVLALFFFGGEVIHNFAFALLIGVMVGTYSSIFVASPLLVFWNASARVQGLTLVPRGTSDDRRRAQRA